MSRRNRDPIPPPGAAYVQAEIVELPNLLHKPGAPLPPAVELTPVGPTAHMSVGEPVEVKPRPKRSRRRRQVERVFDRLGRLPAADRLFIELLVFRGMNAKQVAKVLDITRKEVYIRYGEVMERLARPPRRGFVPPPGPPPQPTAPQTAPAPPEGAGGAA